MKPIEIAKNVYDVGVNDWNIREFHGYSTQCGTSYNSFLIKDDKVTLIDTVKECFADQLLENISKIIEPEKIDYVISNHTEMDHSGGLPEIMHRIGESKPLYCSNMGAKNLSRHFSREFNYHPVKNQEEICIGKKSLMFIETRMLHWPDSMFTYLKEDGILFSSDAFGQHYAGQENFDDQTGSMIMAHAKKYFANILLLYSPLILKLLENVASLDLKINMICPDHGIIWRKDPGKIIEAYAKWAKQEPTKKAVVVYDTMWHSTETMAQAIAAGIDDMGVEVKLMHIRTSDRSEIMTHVFDSGAVVVGSPTINNQMFPTVTDFLCYMKGLKPKNKISAAFGSYGWSGESVRQINREFEAMKFDIIDQGLKIQYVPDKCGKDQCFELGRKIGEKLKT